MNRPFRADKGMTAAKQDEDIGSVNLNPICRTTATEQNGDLNRLIKLQDNLTVPTDNGNPQIFKHSLSTRTL